jgi:hypothetical protein
MIAFENIVASKALSISLYENGINEDSYFFWEVFTPEVYAVKFAPYTIPNAQPHIINYHAYTAEELLHIIPDRIILPGEEPFESFLLEIKQCYIVDSVINEGKEHQQLTKVYILNYYCNTTESGGENAFLKRQLLSNNIKDEFLANALAKLLLLLIKGGYYAVNRK